MRKIFSFVLLTWVFFPWGSTRGHKNWFSKIWKHMYEIKWDLDSLHRCHDRLCWNGECFLYVMFENWKKMFRKRFCLNTAMKKTAVAIMANRRNLIVWRKNVVREILKIIWVWMEVGQIMWNEGYGDYRCETKRLNLIIEVNS